MRIYEKGEKVRLEDESIATVVEVHRQSYELPEGQAIGGPAATHGGEASYTVRDAKGKTRVARDRDVRNPPKAGGEAPPARKRKVKP